MTTTLTDRDKIEAVVNTVLNDGSGEVFAEDVAQIMRDLGLAPALYVKVATTLEDICHNRKVARDFSDDPQWAFDKYVRENPSERLLDAEYFENFYRNEAEQGIALLIGLAALSC